MGQIFIFFLIVLLQISIVIHIIYIKAYIANKKLNNLKGFLVTTLTNFFLALSIIFFIMLSPETLKKIDFNNLKFIEIVFAVTLVIVFVFKKVFLIRRVKKS